jgi:carbamoyl-phosphate synthase large subunit
VRDADKPRLLEVARDLVRRGFPLIATGGTAAFLREHGIECERINKVLEGRPHIVDAIKNGEIAYIVNTTEGRQAITGTRPASARRCVCSRLGPLIIPSFATSV